MSRPGLEPGPPAWEASTLEKSHLDSLYAGYSEPLLMMRLAPFIQTSTWAPQCMCSGRQMHMDLSRKDEDYCYRWVL